MEANKLTKKSFETVHSFFNHYSLQKRPDGKVYQPSLDEEGQRIQVHTPFGTTFNNKDILVKDATPDQ
jgi:hypothetical protein